jgi:hypothetical protein
MTRRHDPDDELLARYADRPEALSPDERRRAEAILAGSDDAMIARVAALPAAGTEPVWDDLARSIRLACVDPPAPRWRRWLAWTPAIGGLAAAAVLVAVWLGRSQPLGPAVAIAPSVVGDPLDEIDADELAPALAPLDEESDEEVAADVGNLDWVEQLDDAELDDLALWLDEQEAG